MREIDGINLWKKLNEMAYTDLIITSGELIRLLGGPPPAMNDLYLWSHDLLHGRSIFTNETITFLIQRFRIVTGYREFDWGS